MKKFTLVIGVLVGLVASGLMSQTVSAAPACSGGDTAEFPYGFLCPREPTDTRAAPFSGSANPGYIPTGSSIQFRGGFDPSGSPAGAGGNTNGAEVFVWATIDGAEPMVGESSITAVSNPGGTSGVASQQCPGAGSPDFGTVYNYRNKNGDYNAQGGNGPDNSPSAYNPQTHNGYEDCGTSGKMVYWKNAVTSQDYGFNLNLPAGRTGQVCVRLDISVRFSSDAAYFPGPVPAGTFNPHEQNVVSSHIAKQSNELCYQVGNQPPQHGTSPNGGLNINACTGNYNVSAFDPDNPGANVEYEIIHGNPSGLGFTVDVPSGSTNRSGTVGHFNVTRDRTYILKARDLNDGQFYTVASQFIGGGGCGGGGGGDAACYTYDRNLQANSIYRITSFPRNGFYVQSTPNPTTRSSKGPFASLASGAEYQSGEFNTGGNYNDGQGSYNASSGNYHLNYPPPTGPDHEVFVENWHHNPDGSWTYSNDTNAQLNCYSASCAIDVDSQFAGVPHGVRADEIFTVRVSINNTGRASLPGNIAGTALGVTGTGDSNFSPGVPLTTADNSSDIPPGVSQPLDPFGVRAPSDVGSYKLGAYPDYYGRFALGAPCEVNGSTGGGPCSGVCGVDVYKHFTISPRANITSDAENPQPVTYTTGGTKTEGPDVTTTDRSWLTYQPPGGAQVIVDGVHNTQRTYGSPPDEVFTYSPPVIAPGDKYCVYLTIDEASGWVGPNNSKTETQPANIPPPETCIIVHNKPYVHFMGSDVSAGGGYGNNCTSVRGAIQTYTGTTGTRPIGSGVQLGALSIDPIEGFNSANLRSAAPTGSMGLTFANNTPPSGGPPAPRLGGNLGGTHCVPDYFTKLPPGKIPSTANNTTLAPVPGRTVQYYTPTTGTLSINPSLIGDNTALTIFVKGNVVIRGNLTYANSTWPDINSVPSLYIIAKGDDRGHPGNIYIDPSVTQLDGLYVGQPDRTSAGGSIYTCANGTAEVPIGSSLATCRNQLLVNGAFVSQHIHLGRALGSLRYSQSGEHLTLGAPKLCGNDPSDATALGDCAAEIFNFSPELFLAQPSIAPSSGPTTGNYEYITSLSPVL